VEKGSAALATDKRTTRTIKVTAFIFDRKFKHSKRYELRKHFEQFECNTAKESFQFFLLSKSFKQVLRSFNIDLQTKRRKEDALI
jgi:hypothetical protein